MVASSKKAEHEADRNHAERGQGPTASSAVMPSNSNIAIFMAVLPFNGPGERPFAWRANGEAHLNRQSRARS
jgi:hypothetical protein